ncbi:MAG TPA: FAD-dependent monooxygenase, partial [Candidatus Peribacteria bacterium]|nr:FAD-dependent monooxygenase [Candidatus Peribacteria bacterium]
LPARAHTYTDPATFHAVIREHFQDMAPMREILTLLPEDAAEMYHNDDEEMHLKQWHSGRVVLLGDAIHALSPILGMGASMALEDARVLSEEIGKCDGDVTAAFVRYHRRRLPRVRHLARWSWILHRMTNVGGPLGRIRNTFLKHAFVRAYFWNLERFMGQKV